VSVTPIRLMGDPVLRTPAAPVVDFDRELRRLVADLTDTMHAAEGAGLAAPQIGVACGSSPGTSTARSGTWSTRT
jgi:peptide deformylase